MLEIIEIETKNGNTSKILVGDALTELSACLPDKRIIIITDSNVHRRYMGVIDEYEHIIIGMGETNKTLIIVDKVYNELIEMRADRDCFILGFGGGIVTDIAGFVASTFMRGISFGFVSSTLLGQVDASIGGKNGVNVGGFKNMAGTFNQPEFVICDTSLLKTISEREFHAGLAEVIKVGIISDPELFALIEGNSPETLKEDSALLTEIITRAIKAKAIIVEHDERETDERRKLNLGHTFAHALEMVTDSYLHGEAVSIGVVMAAEVAVRIGVLSQQDKLRITRVLEKAGLPIYTDIDRNRILKAVRNDKKSEGGNIHFVLPTGIGACEVRKMTMDELGQLI